MRCSEVKTAGGKSGFRPLAWLAGAAAAIVLVPSLLAAWLLLTEAGLRAGLDLARRSTGLSIVAEGLSGRLVGPLHADRLSVESPDWRLDARALALDWSPRALIARRLDIARFEAAELELAIAPSEAAASPPTPPELVLPMPVSADLRLDRLVIAPWAPEDGDALVFADLSARLSSDGVVQHVDALGLTTPWGRVDAVAALDPAAARPLSANGRYATTQQGHAVEVDFRLLGDPADLSLDLEARGAGLDGTASARLAPFEPMPLRALRAALGAVDPAAFADDAPIAALHVEADLTAPDDSPRLAGALQVRNARPLRIDEGGLPFERLAADIDLTPDRLEVIRFSLGLPDGGRAEGRGRFVMADEGPASFSVAASLDGIDPAALHGEAPQGRFGVAFEADGDTTGRATASWTFAPDGRLFGQALAGGGRVAVDGMRVLDAAVDMGLGPSRIRADGAWGQLGDELRIAVDARRLEALGYGLGGSLRVDARLADTATQPAGRFSLRAERLRAPGVSIERAQLEGHLEAGLEGPMALRAELSGVAPAEGEALLARAALRLDGTRAEHALDLDAELVEGDRLVLRLEGGLDLGDPVPAWAGQLATLELSGRLPLRLEAPAALSAGADRAVLAPARLAAGNGGRVELEETVWTPERIAARGRLSGLTVVEQGAPRRGRGPGPLVVGAEWDVVLGETADGSVRVFRESGDIAVPGELSARIGLQHLEVVAAASDNRLALSLDARGSELGTVSGAVTARVERDPGDGWRLAPDAALLGSVRLDMPSIGWLSRLLQQETVLDGALNAQFSFSGTPAAPVAVGRIAGENLALSLVEHGVQLTGGELLAEFDRDRLRLTRLEFVSPNRVRPPDARIPFEALTREPGRLTASGEIALDSGNGRFAFEADRLPILQRTDRWLILSGQGQAHSTWTSLDLEADFRADAGYVQFAESPPPSLSDDVVFVGEEDEAGGRGLAVDARVRVSLGDALYLSALGLDTRLTGALDLRMRDGEGLSATGTIATAGGSYRGYGQNLSIERGLINFQGSLDNPGLNVVALRKGLAVEAGVSVAGSARRPQIRLVSEPEVPDPEKLSWIVLGRAPTAGAGADLGLLIPAAQALLGGPGGGMTDQLSRSLGFDEFGIGQGESAGVGRSQTSRVVGSGTTVTGEGSLGGQVLMLGKRLSSDLYLSFEQSLGGAESLVRLTYQLTRRVAVVARGGSDTAADIYYTISFR